MKGAIIIALASILTVVAAVPRRATSECYEMTTQYQMIFTAFPEDDVADVNTVYAMNLTDPSFDPALEVACGSNHTSFYSFNITGQNEYRIEIAVNKTDLSVDKECGHSNTGLFFEWVFRTAKVEFLLLSNIDIQYRVQCNFSDATQTELTLGPINVTGSIAENAATPNPNTFTFELIDDATSLSVGGTVALGQLVRLQITHDSGDATGVSAYSCKAGNNMAFDVSFDLIDDQGCTVPLGGGPAILPSGFGGTLVSTTGTFQQFSFTTYSTIVYACTVHTCRNNDNVPCDDLCAANTGRKKRAADDVSDEADQTIVAEFHIVPFRKNPYVQPASTDVEEEPKEVPSCLSNVGIIAAFAVLGALLLITIAVAVFVCLRSMRLSSESQRRDSWNEKPRI